MKTGTRVDAILAQYEKNTKKTTSGNNNSTSNEDRLKKYFTTVLPKGEKSGEKRIRIIEMIDGSNPFKEGYFHEVKVGDDYLKLYDPRQEGKRSPLNEVYQALNSSSDPTDKELAKDYYAKKFYIVKVIDRDNEQDGPKFWRFKHNGKNEGILDKIVPIIRNKGNIMSATDGRDLTLALTLSKNPKNGKEYTTITSIIPEDKSPLHEDATIAKEWINDPLTWEDVYSKKPEDYLEIVAKGEIPKWDNELKKYISTSQNSEEINLSQKPIANSLLDPQAEEKQSDDLPF
jgi:hypothetical protein